MLHFSGVTGGGLREPLPHFKPEALNSRAEGQIDLIFRFIDHYCVNT
jgi:hypothetical protein